MSFTDEGSVSAPRRLAGSQRRITDDQVNVLRNWKPFKDLCREYLILVAAGCDVTFCTQAHAND